MGYNVIGVYRWIFLNVSFKIECEQRYFVHVEMSNIYHRSILNEDFLRNVPRNLPKKLC